MNLKKLLTMLLIAVLTLSPVAMMEDAELCTDGAADITMTTSEETMKEDTPVFNEAEASVTQEASVIEEGIDAESDEKAVLEPDVEIMPDAIDGAVEAQDNLELENSDSEVLDETEVEYDPMMAAAGNIALNSDNFPDTNFLAYVKQFDEDSNSFLSDAERNKVTEVFVIGNGLTSLKGIENFPNLKTLNCMNNQLSSLDIDGCDALTSLICSGNQLTSLSINNHKALKYLSCFDSPQLTSLMINNCANLTELYCYNSQLKDLKISGCAALLRLYCWDNNLKSLNVSGFTALSELFCKNNKLTSLDISKNSDLHHLDCSQNDIASLDISNCSDLINAVQKGERSEIENVIWYEYNKDVPDVLLHYRSLRVDKGVTIISEKASAPTVAVPAPAVPVTPVIAAVKKTSKTTIIAAPGSVYQLDLGGAAGKKFKSSKKKVATVNSIGLVTIKKAGKTKITFKVGKKTRTVTLTVKDPTVPTAVYLNLSGTVPAQVGVPQALTVTLPAGTTSGVKWKSSNKKVATVSNGVVTFKKAGKVTVTATATRGKKKAKVKFIVTK